MKTWSPPQRPIDYAQESLVKAILDQTFPPESTLPSERDLAAQLGVTRPTLREVLRRLEREGWITVQQGKPTQVNNIWLKGGLNILGTLVQYSEHLSPDFIPNLLEVRVAFAPNYTRAAIERDPEPVISLLSTISALKNNPPAYAKFDWNLHYTLTIASKNPIYTFILNGFVGFYEQMATLYFFTPEARQTSYDFYTQLLDFAKTGNSSGAEALTHQVMQQSIVLWGKYNQELALSEFITAQPK